MKILVVDDDELNRKVLKAILEDSELNSVEAENGRQALDIIEADREIKIVLLDRMMPVMDGMEFMKHYMQRADSDSRAIIMQTAANQPKDVIEGKTAGAYYYLTKPFDEEVVLSVIRAAKHDLQKKGVI